MSSSIFSAYLHHMGSVLFLFVQEVSDVLGLTTWSMEKFLVSVISAVLKSDTHPSSTVPCYPHHQSASVALCMNHWIAQAGRIPRKGLKGSSSPIPCFSQRYVKLLCMTKNIIQTVLDVTVGLHLHLDSFTLTLICQCRIFCAYHLEYEIIHSLGK